MTRGEPIAIRDEQEIHCGNCVGACCQNILGAFSYEEVQQLEAAGTQILTILDATPVKPENPDDTWDWGALHADIIKAIELCHDPNARGLLEIAADASRNLRPGEGYFQMLGRCGNLASNNSCDVYETRPNTCKKFVMSSPGCLVMRASVHDRFLSNTPESIEKMAGRDYGHLVRALLEVYK